MFFQREFRPNRRCCRRTEGCTSQLKLPSFLVGLFLSITLSQIWLSVRPIFTVLPITLSFLVHFQPEKYWIEGLDMLFSMVRRWSIKSCFWPGHDLGQTLVKPSQLWSNLSKPREIGPRLCFENFVMHLRLFRVELGSVRLPRFTCRHSRKFRG